MYQNQTQPFQLPIIFFDGIEPIIKENYKGQWNQWPTDSVTNITIIQRLSQPKDKLPNAEKKSDLKKGGIQHYWIQK